MYGLNAFAFVLFVGLNLLAYQLCRQSAAARRRVTRALCAALLSLNALRYGLIYPVFEGGARIPVEFSTVAYFVVPVALLTERRGVRGWAAYSGLMAGFFYYAAVMVLGGPVYSTLPPYDTYISLLCHGTLYFCGLVTVGTTACDAKDAPKLLLGVACVAAWALLLRPFVGDTGRYFIYMLLDGLCVKSLLPQASWGAALPAYYVAASALVLLSVWGFFKVGERQYARFAHSG